MANIGAAQSGDFSATSTWVGGVVPGSSDIAYANTFTVTISDTRTVQAVSNASGTGITVGGTFSLLNGCNLTCTNANGVVQGATTTSCITTPSLGVGSTASVAANITAAVSNAPNVLCAGSGALNWTGNIAVSTTAFQITGNGAATIVGNIGGTSRCLLSLSGVHNLTVIGNITGGTSSDTLNLVAAGSTYTFTGNVTGGSSISAPVAANAAVTLTINGTCTAGSAAPAVSSSNSSATCRFSGPFLLGSNPSINPIYAISWRWAPTQIPTYYEVVASNGTTKRNLYTADNMPSGGYPTQNNTRSGTIYGPNNEFTGTLAVPSPSSVALGVATDNTVGTAILTAANIRTAVGLASANLDTQFTNIPTAVWNALTSSLTTVGSIGKLLVDNINTTISSRLASNSYTAPLDAAGTRTAVGLSTANLDAQIAAIPSASTNASAVRTNLATELTRIDVAVSSAPPSAASIAFAVWSAATRTLSDASGVASAVWSAVSRTITGGTVDNLTNAPNVPSAATIASAVRTELTTELARIDVATSTRLEPSGTLARVTLTDTATTLTNSPNVPSAATIAAAVWAAADKTGYSLTTAERQAIATVVEQSILNETDGQQVLNAIVGAIGNTNVDQVALVAAIRADIERSGGMLAGKSTLTAAQVWSNTTRTITGGTVDTLTNSPNVPSASAIASQVRTELTPELARVANCATVETTANTVQDAVGG